MAAPSTGSTRSDRRQIKRRRGMRSHRRGFTWLAVMALGLILGAVATAQEKQWWPFPVEDRDPSLGEIGTKAGDYPVKMQPKGAKPVKVDWFPGPPGAGWVVAGNKGFVEAVSKGAIDIVSTKYGDTGKEVQLKLVEDVLQAYPNIDYIVGTSPTTEAAAQALREAGKADKIKVLAYYFTPGVYQDIKRGAVLAAPTDSAVIQGRIAIDQAVRILEKKPYTKHTGPEIYVIDKSNINTFHYESSLAPANFSPTFSVD